jgi:tetratricopeptide (TPR) repeat protein
MLSSRDLAVLDVIFTSKGEYSFDQIKSSVDDRVEDRVEYDDESRKREQIGVESAESGDLNKALEIFSSLISDNPNYSSARNNRAQVLRLMGRDDEALKDLDYCLSLKPSRSISRQVYTQKSIIYKKRKDFKASDEALVKAAQCGSAEAKCIVKEKNPFAKMCNQAYFQAVDASLNDSLLK